MNLGNINKFRPIGDQVLILADKTEEKIGSIYVPDNAKEKRHTGTIIKIGDGETLKDGTIYKVNVKEGDKVLFSKYAGTDIQFTKDDNEYILVKQTLIWGVFDE